MSHSDEAAGNQPPDLCLAMGIGGDEITLTVHNPDHNGQSRNNYPSQCEEHDKNNAPASLPHLSIDKAGCLGRHKMRIVPKIGVYTPRTPPFLI